MLVAQSPTGWRTASDHSCKLGKVFLESLPASLCGLLDTFVFDGGKPEGEGTNDGWDYRVDRIPLIASKPGHGLRCEMHEPLVDLASLAGQSLGEFWEVWCACEVVEVICSDNVIGLGRIGEKKVDEDTRPDKEGVDSGISDGGVLVINIDAKCGNHAAQIEFEVVGGGSEVGVFVGLSRVVLSLAGLLGHFGTPSCGAFRRVAPDDDERG